MLGQRLAQSIENQEALDSPAAAVSDAVGKVLKPGAVKDALSGTAIGHPAHPAIIVLPIGSWLSASFLDFFGGSESRDAARKLIALGLLSALPAAATGASDWSDTTGAERRVGLVHALANTTGLGLYLASWRARRRGRQVRGVALALAGAGVVGFSGWLGGHLAYALGVGVDTTVFLGGATDWTDVAAEADLVEGQPMSATAGVAPVVLVKQAGQVFALNDRCTHRGGPLHEGSVTNGCIECPWHGSQFRLTDGSIARGPATQPEPTFDVRVESGRVLVRRGSDPRSGHTSPVAATTV